MNNTGANSDLHPEDDILPSYSQNLLNKLQDYDPSKTPPNLDIARIHGRAHRVSQAIVKTRLGDKYCPCCGFNSNNRQFSLCTGSRNINSIGTSVALYFSYLKTLIILTAMVAFSTCFFLVGYYATGDYCETVVDACKEDFFLQFSIINRKGNFTGLSAGVIFILSVPIFLNLGSFFSHLYMRYQSQMVGFDHLTASDYTIMIENMPKSFTDNEITMYFEYDCDFGIRMKVNRVVRCFDIDDFVKATLKRSKILFEKAVAEQKGDNEQNVLRLTEELHEVEVDLEAKKQETLQHNFNGVVFLTFEDSEMMRRVHKYYKMGFFSRLCSRKHFVEFKQHRLKIKRAPEPSDIIWKNLGIKFCTKIMLRIMGILFATLAWGTCYGAILFLLIYRSIVAIKSEFSIFDYIYYYGSASAVSVINVLLNMIIRKAMDIVCYDTTTRFSTGVSVFLALIQFFNSNIASMISIYTFQSIQGTGFSHFEHNTIVSYALTVQTSNCILLPVLNLFNPSYFILLFRRMLLQKGIPKNISQQEANLLFEGPILDLPQRYANITLIFLSSMFFLSVTPICIVPAFIGLTLSYFIDKYLLLRRHSIPADLGKEIGFAMNDFVHAGAFMFLGGKVSFYYLVFEEFAWTDTSIAILVFILSITRFWRHAARLIFPKIKGKSEDDDTYPPFSELAPMLMTDYDRANPIMQKEAMLRFLQKGGGDSNVLGRWGTAGANLRNRLNPKDRLARIGLGMLRYNSLLGDESELMFGVEIRDEILRQLANSEDFRNGIITTPPGKTMELGNIGKSNKKSSGLGQGQWKNFFESEVVKDSGKGKKKRRKKSKKINE